MLNPPNPPPPIQKKNTKSIQMGKRNTKKNKTMFIELYRQLDCNISRTCVAVRIDRATYRAWTLSDKDFAEKVEDTEEAVLDELESTVLKKAHGFEVETKKIVVKKITSWDSKKQKSTLKGEEKTLTKTTRYYPPDMIAAKLYFDAKGRHRGYGMKPDESDQGQEETDRDSE